jgi:Kef-type K+ transport system membrane component KefB
MTSDLSQFGFLLSVSALVAMLTRRLHLPYTVGLVLAGMALYFSHRYASNQVHRRRVSASSVRRAT